MKLTQGQIIDLHAIATRPGIYRFCPPTYDSDLRDLAKGEHVTWKDGHGYKITEKGQEALKGWRR